MESLLIGKVIDINYKISGVLGKGGMGVVYKAHDMTLDRDVALKMMDVRLAEDEAFLRRFQSEAKALAKLRNHNVVTIYALRECELGLCIVMEFVDGQTLADLIRRSGPVPPQRAIYVFKQVLTALGHAHRAGIIHRDIKPSNIMLAEDDFVKVADFGLAKIQQSGTVTATMGAGGTLYYMSPEQLRGLANVDHRGDIYSVGMTLYEALAARPPFKDSDSDFTIREAIVKGAIPPPDKIKPDLPKELVKVVMKAIDKDPAKRYQSATEMLKALEKCETLGKAEVPKRVDERTVVIRAEKGRRSRAPWFVASTVAVLILIGYFLWPTLFPPHALISITTEPPGSTVRINGKDIGAAPIPNYQVPAGNVSMRIQRQKYKTIDTSFVLERGESKTLALSLEKVAGPVVPEPMGSLEITSEPLGAEVYIDGRATGKTPTTLAEIPAGTHTIELRREGFKDFVTTVKVSQEQISKVEGNLVMIPEPVKPEPMGSLQITSEPLGAAVFIDGRTTGKTPTTIKSIKAGTYTVKLTREGYKDLVTTVKVSEEQASKVEGNLVMVPKPVEPEPMGSLQITSDPPGAEILIDGTTSGKTPTKLENVTAGSHNIKLRQKGFKDFVANVTVSAGQAAEVKGDLESLIGMLKVRVKPFGSLYVDDKLLRENAIAPVTETVPVGKRRVKAIHPVYGVWEKETEIVADKVRDVLFDFDKTCKLNISAVDEAGERLPGKIYVDSKFTNKYAPMIIVVRPGAHTIEVRMDKYESVEAPRVITVEKDQPLKFRLKKVR